VQRLAKRCIATHAHVRTQARAHTHTHTHKDTHTKKNKMSVPGDGDVGLPVFEATLQILVSNKQLAASSQEPGIRKKQQVPTATAYEFH